MSASSSPADFDRTTITYKIFCNYLTDKTYKVPFEDLIDLIRSLNVDFTHFSSPSIPNLVPYIAAMLIRSWPGWQYITTNGNFNQAEQLQSFHTHLKAKAQEIAQIDMAELTRQIDVELPEDHEQIIQVACPPKLLNSIAFSLEADNLVYMKQHTVKKWQSVNDQQILNWPHVQIVFQTSSFKMIRTQKNCMERFLHYSHSRFNIKHRKCDSNIVSCTTIENDKPQRVCTYELLETYIEQYLQYVAQREKGLHDMCALILRKFLKDIKNLNYGDSIADNTAVHFRQTPDYSYVIFKRFKRNAENAKQLQQCEVIKPAVQLELNQFSDELVEGEQGPTFPKLEKIKQQEHFQHPVIFFKCTFCSKIYLRIEDIKQHFYAEHSVERDIICCICLKSFSIYNLTQNGWFHACLDQSQIIEIL